LFVLFVSLFCVGVVVGEIKIFGVVLEFVVIIVGVLAVGVCVGVEVNVGILLFKLTICIVGGIVGIMLGVDVTIGAIVGRTVGKRDGLLDTSGLVVGCLGTYILRIWFISAKYRFPLVSPTIYY
jgi:hypothetical protein